MVNNSRGDDGKMRNDNGGDGDDGDNTNIIRRPSPPAPEFPINIPTDKRERAGSPKSAQPWSHPAVYLAGRDSDWFFLANNEERLTWPVFREHYQRYAAAVLRGETLVVPAPEALEQHKAEPLSPEAQLAELKKLRDSSGL